MNVRSQSNLLQAEACMIVGRPVFCFGRARGLLLPVVGEVGSRQRDLVL